LRRIDAAKVEQAATSLALYSPTEQADEPIGAFRTQMRGDASAPFSIVKDGFDPAQCGRVCRMLDRHAHPTGAHRLKANLAVPLNTMASDTRLLFQTRDMVTLTRGSHMISFFLPEHGPARRLSQQAAAMTECLPQASCRVGDLQRLADVVVPDPDAEEKLHAMIDLIWRAAAFQREPPIRDALVGLVAGFTEHGQALV